MTRDDRNFYFEEKEHLINMTVNRHRALIRACRLEDDDVYQQLSVRLLDAVEKYDPAKCPNMDAYLMLQLRYELLNMKACSKLTGVTGAPKDSFTLLSLDEMEDTGYQVQDSDNSEPSNVIWLWQQIFSLPATQKTALSRFMSGERISCNNRSLQAARHHIKQQLVYSGSLQCA
jgi:hypothetical protein